MNSLVAYRGPSVLDGAPIRVLVTLRSANTKTGDIPQVFILRDDIAPHSAQASGEDSSVCGDCPLRPSVARGTGGPVCYVRTFQGPRSAWEATKSTTADLGKVCGSLRLMGARTLRLGAYGDPAAIPRDVVERLSGAVERTLGYTHQWRDRRHAWLRAFCMASCDGPEDYARAVAEGWRTFRVLRRASPVTARREILCPSDRGVTCAECRLCDGTRPGDPRKSIAILQH